MEVDPVIGVACLPENEAQRFHGSLDCIELPGTNRLNSL
jgi:hypothetical protein